MNSGFERAFHYNERKVRLGSAEFIHAGNFLEETWDLKPAAIRARFKRLDELNRRASKKTFHASLNFHPGEQLSDRKLSDIADRYLEILGLARQPFLVYKHLDAAHPHIHVVSTLINSDGKKICTWSPGLALYLNAARQVETEFGLLRAGMQKEPESPGAKARPEIIHYGKSPGLFKKMEHIVDMAVSEYHFCSIRDFNALLAQYNLRADRGSETSYIYKNGGLMFHVLDESGHKTGIPIKASAFGSKPTLKNIRKKMEEEGLAEETRLRSIRSRIEWALLQASGGFEAFVHELGAEDIRLVLLPERAGQNLPIFVDLKTRTVVSSLELGNYSEPEIRKRIGRAYGPDPSLADKAGLAGNPEEYPLASDQAPYEPSPSGKCSSWSAPGAEFAAVNVRRRSNHR
jgi:hypothetical protein